MNEKENQKFVLNEIAKYLFETNGSTGGKNKEKFFDVNLDFKYYYYDFLKLGIDLLTDYVSWWKFESILHGISLDKNSSFNEVISFRTYKKPPKNIKTQQEQEHKFRMKMKRIYSLPNSIVSTDDQLSKLWGYVEKKAGDEKV